MANKSVMRAVGDSTPAALVFSVLLWLNHDERYDLINLCAYFAEPEKRYFSVVDVVCVLTKQPDTRCAAKYWSVLKKEGSQLPTKRRQLTLMSADRNRYLTDVADNEQLLQ